jgi:hypothetical protein
MNVCTYCVIWSPPPPKETWEQRTSKVRYLEVIEYKSYGELWDRTIYLQNSFCIFYKSELNFTQNSYKKYNKFKIIIEIAWVA